MDFEHMGVRYQVEITEQKGRWDWWYQVEGGKLIRNMDSPAKSEGIALEEAQFAAKNEIRRRLEAM